MKQARNIIGGLGNLMFIKAYLIAQMMDGEIPDTYIQQYSRWNKYKDIVKSTFMEDIVPGSVNKVSLHIRRGDYLNKKNFYVDLTETDYYQNAVKWMDDHWMSNAIGGWDGHTFAEPPTYLVFCKDNQGWKQDKADRQWCRDFLDTFIPGRYEFVSKNNLEHEDMNLMASCKAHIGANSSFSWFACFLGGGITVMPQAWFVSSAVAQPVEMLSAWELI